MMTEPIELTPELLAALKAQASEWDRGSLKINTMPFDPRVVLALLEHVATLKADLDAARDTVAAGVTMANNAQWECSVWGEGQTVLVYWDSMHSEDIMIILEPDGTAYIRDWTFEDDEDEGGTEVRTPIDNLVLWLRQWAEGRRG